MKIDSQPLPFDLVAEQALLGCILQDNSKYLIVLNYINNDNMIYSSDNRLIFVTIKNMMSKKIPVDIITLIDEMKKKNSLDTIGGAYYITGLSNEAPSAENIEYYCNIVREKYLQRQTILASLKLKEFAYKNIDSTDEYLIKMKMTAEEMLGTRPGITSSLTDIADDAINSIETGENIIFFDNFVISKIIKGITRGGIAAVGARTGNMKTTLSTFMMKEYLSQNKNNVGIMFNLQMTNTEIIKKLIAMESNVSYSKIREARKMGDFDTGEKKQIKAAQELIKVKYKNFHMFDNVRTLDRIIFEINKLRPDLIIIDYIQLVKVKGLNNVKEIMVKVMEDIEWESKPKNSNFGTIMVSQLNREVKDRFDPRPTLTDFKESGAIEEGCETAVMPFYGHSFDNVRFPESEMYEIMVRKSRFGNPASYLVGWNGDKQKFFKPSVSQIDTWRTIRKKSERKRGATL